MLRGLTVYRMNSGSQTRLVEIVRFEQRPERRERFCSVTMWVKSSEPGGATQSCLRGLRKSRRKRREKPSCDSCAKLS